MTDTPRQSGPLVPARRPSTEQPEPTGLERARVVGQFALTVGLPLAGGWFAGRRLGWKAPAVVVVSAYVAHFLLPDPDGNPREKMTLQHPASLLSPFFSPAPGAPFPVPNLAGMMLATSLLGAVVPRRRAA